MADIIGTGSDDILDGTPGEDTIRGVGGDDVINGLGGDDFLAGGAGEDVVSGGEGDDRIFAGEDDEDSDLMVGGDGDDEIGGGAGDDVLIGDGHVADTVIGTVGDVGADTIYGGSGDDLIITGTYVAADDASYADAGGNAYAGFISGGSAGPDQPEVVWAGEGDDIIYGSDGADVLGGGDGNDEINGGGGVDVIYAAAGDDVVRGGGGGDLIFNGSGDDVVMGGGGADVIWAGAGDDELTGGSGGDTFGFDANGPTGGNGDDVITDFSFAEGDTLRLVNYGLTTKGAVLDLMEDDGAGNVVLTLSDEESITFESMSKLEFRAASGWLDLGDDAEPEPERVVHTVVDDLLPTQEEAPEKMLFWGYTPDDEAAGTGIPVTELLSFLNSITGLDFAELGVIDDDGVGPDQIGDITLAMPTESESGLGSVTITGADGTVLFEGEASLGEDYLGFLSGLLFDADGNSRLYWAEDPDAPEDDPADRLVLTPSENSFGLKDGTQEGLTTTASDDLIQIGRMELLHRAYIDGGEGLNTLELDAKGVFAQPLSVQNVQILKIANLPNFYEVGSDPEMNSFLDANRFIDLERLVITEGFGDGEGLGELTVAGIRNGAVTRLEGGFSQDLNLHYGEGLGDAVTLELNIGDLRDDGWTLNVAHNSSTLNIISDGGYNALETLNTSDGKLTTLNIAGEAGLYFGSNLAEDFQEGRPAVINAIGNAGGVDLNFDGSEADTSEEVVIYGSSGDDEWQVEDVDLVDITLQDGDNRVLVDDASKVSISAGDGDNVMLISADSEISMTTGAGDDYVTITGTGGVDSGSAVIDNGALLEIDLGEGENTLHLGYDEGDSLPIPGEEPNDASGVTALPGSSIAGENIRLIVDKASDLSKAEISGVTSVVLQQDTEFLLSLAQFQEIGADAFTTEFEAFGETSTLTLVIDEDTDFDALGDLTDMVGRGVRVAIELKDGAELTLTAEQLHEFVAVEDGVTTTTPGETGSVVITNAGLDFEAFDPNADNPDGTDGNGGPDGGTLHDDFEDGGLTVERDFGGFNRPYTGPSSDTLTIDTSEGPAVFEEPIEADEVSTLIVTGPNDLTFEDVAVTLDENFTIDLSGFTGSLNGFTVADFQKITTDRNIADVADWGEIIGNGDPDARINIELSGDVGFDNDDVGGFKSSGVPTYMVTDLNGVDRVVHVCDQTEDVTTLGLQGNGGNKLSLVNVRWDVQILLEGDGGASAAGRPKAEGSPDESNIGEIEVDYFTGGATADILINNQGVAPGATLSGDADRSIVSDGINLRNAAGANIVVEDGNAVIDHITDVADGDDTNVTSLTFTSDFDVTVKGGLFSMSEQLETLDASGVAGTFTLVLDGPDDLDLSETDLSGVDRIELTDPDAGLTLTADQIIEIGPENIVGMDAAGDPAGTLNVVGLAEQALDLGAMEIDAIGTVKTADQPVITLDPTTTLGGAESLEILAKEGNTELRMTAAQFKQLDGAAPDVMSERGENDDDNVDGLFNATLSITEVDGSTQLDFSDVASGDDDPGTDDRVEDDDADNVAVRVEINGVTANEDDLATPEELLDEQFKITGNDDTTLVVTGGANDLTLGDLSGIDGVTYTGEGASLDLTADQVADIQDITADDASEFVTTTTGNVLNVADLGGQELNLNVIQDAGIEIGTVTIADADTDDDPVSIEVTALDPETTFGGADVVIPAGTEVTMTLEQFRSTSGTITGDGVLNITGLNDDNAEDGLSLDLSGVTATAGTLTMADADADLTFSADSDLGEFSVTLNDVESDPAVADELAGETVRFSNAAQAERKIIVTGVDAGGERDTNVVWEFDTIEGTEEAGKVDTSEYNAGVGRLWIRETLADGANVSELFTRLNDSTIIRVEDPAQIDVLLRFEDVTRTVELVSFLDLPGGLTFSELDEEATGPFPFVENLTFNAGGEVNVGDVVVDDIISGPASGAEGDNEFDTLIINSFAPQFEDDPDTPGVDEGDAGDHLLPDGGDFGTDSGQLDFPDAANVFGDISGGTRNVLKNVKLNADYVAIEAGTIIFSDDDAGDSEGDGSAAELTTTAAPPAAGLPGGVTIKGVDLSDPEITGFTHTHNGPGTFIATGGSPAFDGGAAAGDTETFTINANGGDVFYGYVVEGGEEVINTDGDGNPYAGVAGADLSEITVDGTGDVSLGYIAQVDGEDFALTGQAGPGEGQTSAFLGEAMVNGTLTAPTLSATGTWTFTDVDLTIDASTTLEAGSTLRLTDSPVTFTGGAVDLTEVTLSEWDDVSEEWVEFQGSLTVEAGASLTLTAAQADGLTINGAGDVTVTDMEDTPGADLSGIMTADGDTGSVTALVDTANGDDPGANTVTLEADQMGVAAIEVTNSEDGVDDGRLEFNGVFASYDRDGDPETPRDRATVQVATGITVVLTALQAEAIGGTSGAGTTEVLDLGALFSDPAPDPEDAVDFSGLGSATVEMAVDSNATLPAGSDLGAAVVTIASGVELTAEPSTIDGKTINGPGTLYINPTLSGGDDELDAHDMDLSNIGADIEFAPETLIGTTFPELTGDPSDPDPDTYQTVTLTGAQASGETITGADSGAEGEIVINGLPEASDHDDDEGTDDRVVVDFSNLDAGVMTLTVEEDATLAPGSNLGDVDVVVENGVTLTLTGAQASGLSITGAGSVVVTEVSDGDDLSGIETTGGFEIETEGQTAFELAAAQADGAVITDAGDPDTLETITVTGLEDAADGVDLTALDGTNGDGDDDPDPDLDIIVQLDSSGGFEIPAATDLGDDPSGVGSEAGDNLFLEISGNGVVTVADGADIDGATILVNSDATLVVDGSLDSASQPAMGAVHGVGTLRFTEWQSGDIDISAGPNGGVANVEVQLDAEDGETGHTIEGFKPGPDEESIPNPISGESEDEFTITSLFLENFDLDNADFAHVATAFDATADEEPTEGILSFGQALAAGGADDNATGVAAAFTAAGPYVSSGTADFGAGAERLFLIDGDAATNGNLSDVSLWHFQDTNEDGEVGADELTRLARLDGLADDDLSDLTASNFDLV